MKKSIFLSYLFFAGFSIRAFAGTGTARDEMAFIMAIAGILLLLVGLLSGIDFIQKNGKTLIRKTKVLLYKCNCTIEGYFHKDESEYTATEP
ncbi:MAG: hypothetical protein KQI35_01720 [Bacteroidetes bacterium]|nr:hypothetical protein [Bacteroidota bacterium]